MSGVNESYPFPDDFIWGTATAAYQVEGAANESGKSQSIWDTFSHLPGKIQDGKTGDIACDHYHRYKEDVQLLRKLGVSSYRFSISWPRIAPEPGRISTAGFDFYKRLIEQLRENNIRPAVTLYHWDLPQRLEDRGGWANRETIAHFLDFAEAAFRALGDDVPLWITINEPWCASILSYGLGEQAPGLRDWRKAYLAAHHLLLAHGETVKLYRSSGLTGQIGITLNLNPAYPATDSAADKAAASRQDSFFNRWFLDPVLKGHYPAEFSQRVERYAGPLNFIQPGDMETISRPMDFLGVNFYSHTVVENDGDSLSGGDSLRPGRERSSGRDSSSDRDHLPPGMDSSSLLGVKHVQTHRKVTDMGWEIAPGALYDLLKRLESDYGRLPLIITENGAAFTDVVENGKVRDTERILYLKNHLEAARRFLTEGGNLKGYYLWSLMDNFEWSLGYTKRFGIIYVDFDKLTRIPKESFYWYQRVIAENAVKGTNIFLH